MIWILKHSKWGLRLIHDVTTSDKSAPTPKFLTIDPSRLRAHGGYQAKGGAIYPFTAYQGAETLDTYMIWICEALQVGFEEARLWCNYIRQVGPRLVFILCRTKW
jgi:hypothetical protein